MLFPPKEFKDLVVEKSHLVLSTSFVVSFLQRLFTKLQHLRKNIGYIILRQYFQGAKKYNGPHLCLNKGIWRGCPANILRVKTPLFQSTGCRLHLVYRNGSSPHE